MVNINGVLKPKSRDVFFNRGYLYGDSVFETLLVIKGTLLFWEDHYFRLMASMRILRMDIPMNFTMEFFETEILKTISASYNIDGSAFRVRLNIDRGYGGKYLPNSDSKVGFGVQIETLHNTLYSLYKEDYVVDLYKDYFIAPGLLSGLKTNNKSINVIGSIYAKENELDNCLILNTNKSVVEALNGNVFLLKDNILKTPPLEDGCLRGIMRKQILKLTTKNPNITVVEDSISPFELQKADELFITNVIKGVQPISQYRKKRFSTAFSKTLITTLNTHLNLA